MLGVIKIETMTVFYFDSLQDKPTKDFQKVINMYVFSFIFSLDLVFMVEMYLNFLKFNW